MQAFLEQAAADPHVLAIKQTLYRTSGDSPIVEALIDAAEAGKQVLALVEIKARFDEQSNIAWARKLEKAGVHVVYGLVGLKTHCKLALVIREEKGVLKHYSHIGTGNYNPKTCRIYEDLGLLTADDQVGKDLTRLFNELSGYAIEKKFKRLLVAPLHLRKGLLKRIRQRGGERRGRPAVRHPDQAQLDRRRGDHRRAVPREPGRRAGRHRGARHLRAAAGLRGAQREHPGALASSAATWSTRASSRSSNDGDPQVYIGSADMMHRNLDRRVEALVRLTDPEHLAELGALFDLRVRRARPPRGGSTRTASGRATTSTTGEPLADLQTKLMQQISHRPRSGRAGTRR